MIRRSLSRSLGVGPNMLPLVFSQTRAPRAFAYSTISTILLCSIGSPPPTLRNVGFQPPAIGEEEIAAVAETLRSGWLTTGPRAAELERRFAEYTGAKHAIALSSGTAALHLAIVALGIGPGDEVVTTPI